jgi:4-hydroxy-2-oxoheptanedioate aldolase
MVRCFQAIAPHPVTPMVRVPWNEPGIIGKVLDAGAMNIICPMVNNRAEAEAFIRACKYPPAGIRSNGPIRAGMYGEAGRYQEVANDEILCLPMIETREAVANLEAILDTPGIGGVYVGPTDLGMSHGLAPKIDREEPQILDIFGRVLEQASKRGLSAGLHCGSASYAARAIGMGFRLVTVNSDIGLMTGAASASVAQVRREAGLEGRA